MFLMFNNVSLSTVLPSLCFESIGCLSVNYTFNFIFKKFFFVFPSMFFFTSGRILKSSE